MKHTYSPAIRAFTLVELLVVIGIMGLVLALVAPVFSTLQTAGQLTKTAADIQSTLELARAQAMANNTYVYVGIREYDALNGTNSDGIGKLVVAVMSTKDGTRSGTNDAGLFVFNVSPVGKPRIFDNVHLGSPSNTQVGGMVGRPSGDTVLQLATNTTKASFNWPPPDGRMYSFTKVIEFDPRGVARLQTNLPFDSTIGNYMELYLQPAKGNVPLTNSANQASVQIDGVSGSVRVYRP
jgi:prepilin-type N-terminal cleavage/methylation domain-containing protein